MGGLKGRHDPCIYRWKSTGVAFIFLSQDSFLLLVTKGVVCPSQEVKKKGEKKTESFVTLQARDDKSLPFAGYFFLNVCLLERK